MFLAIATTIPVLLMTAFVLQGQIYLYSKSLFAKPAAKILLIYSET